MKYARQLLILLAFFPIGSVRGAINPEEFTKGHPERVRITVLASHVVPGHDLTQVVLLARVDTVEHSESRLRPGDPILIAYDQDHKQYRRETRAMERRSKSGWVGPQILYYPPVLRAGDSCLAHLAITTSKNGSGALYEPRGHQYAFALEDQ